MTTTFLIIILVICAIWAGIGIHAYLTGNEWSKTSEDMAADFFQELGDSIIEDIKGKKDKKEEDHGKDEAL